MKNVNAIRLLTRTLFFLTATLMTIHFACSEKSKQADMKEMPSAEVKAELVYYAMPG